MLIGLQDFFFYLGNIHQNCKKEMTSSEHRFHIYNPAAAHQRHGWGNPEKQQKKKTTAKPINTQNQSSGTAVRPATAALLLQLCSGNNEEMKVALPASIAL